MADKLHSPRLHQPYGREEAISFFGSADEAQSLCDGQWLIFPKFAVCLATLGEPPKNCHFADAACFHWVADRPYRRKLGLQQYFVPEEVVGPGGAKRSIRLFVRSAGEQEYVYAGELAPSYMQELPGATGHGMAEFKLRPALSSSVWLRLGGPALGDLDFGPVDEALSRLRGEATAKDRLNVLWRLVEYWYGPIRPEDGMSAEELAGAPLPAPLRRWYAWAGKRREIMSGQNIMFQPCDEQYKFRTLRVEDGHLLFHLENQGVYEWSTLPEGEDPPVFGRWSDSEPWEPEGVTLSGHLVLMCMFEAAMCNARYGGFTSFLEEEKIAEIAKTIPPVAIGSWRWLETKFYAGRGAIMWTMDGGNYKGKTGCSVCIGAKTEHPLEFLRSYADDDWEHVAF